VQCPGETSAVFDILAATFAVIAFALLALRSYRVHKVSVSLPVISFRPRSTLSAFVRETYPEFRSFHRGGPVARQLTAGTLPPSWSEWFNLRRRSSHRSLREKEGRGWEDAIALHRMYQIDVHVLGAVAGLLRRRIEAFSDLHRPFQWWIHPQGDTAYVDGYDRQFAERILAGDIQAAGHTVILDDGRNGERFLRVDGKPFPMKPILQFDHHKHLEKNPGTNPITPDHFFQPDQPLFDLDPSTALNRIGMLAGIGLDNAFGSGKAVAAGSLHAPVITAAGAGGFDAPNPFITLGLSSLREIRLLLRRHTTLRTAAKNIGLDVAGTGFGSFAGAKAGATIGTAFGPGVGSVVGAIIGGISGAFAGRSITNRIKMASAETARKFYAEKLRQFQERLVQVTTTARSTLEETTRREQALLRQTGTARLNELAALESRLATANRHAFVLPPSEIKRLFVKCENDLRKKEQETLVALRTFSVWKRFVWPAAAAYRLTLQRASLLELVAQVSEMSAVLLGPGCPLQELEKTCVCLEELSAFEGFEESIRNYLSAYKITVTEGISTLAGWPEEPLQDLSRKREAALARVREKAAALRRRTELQLRSDVRRAKRAQNRFAYELRKLGLAR
jgi:hypothetical protein